MSLDSVREWWQLCSESTSPCRASFGWRLNASSGNSRRVKESLRGTYLECGSLLPPWFGEACFALRDQRFAHRGSHRNVTETVVVATSWARQQAAAAKAQQACALQVTLARLPSGRAQFPDCATRHR